MNKTNIILIPISLFGLMAFCIFVFVVSGAFAVLMPEPPEPQITYGEFPFCITYEVDGKIRVYEDVIICEYVGVENLGTAGKYRKWSSKLKSGNERAILLKNSYDHINYDLSTNYGLPEYYMGDFRQSVDEYERQMSEDRFFAYTELINGIQKGRLITKEEAWIKYNIRIISKEFSKPINNSFSKKDSEPTSFSIRKRKIISNN